MSVNKAEAEVSVAGQTDVTQTQCFPPQGISQTETLGGSKAMSGETQSVSGSSAGTGLNQQLHVSVSCGSNMHMSLL